MFDALKCTKHISQVTTLCIEIQNSGIKNQISRALFKNPSMNLLAKPKIQSASREIEDTNIGVSIGENTGMKKSCQEAKGLVIQAESNVGIKKSRPRNNIWFRHRIKQIPGRNELGESNISRNQVIKEESRMNEAPSNDGVNDMNMLKSRGGLKLESKTGGVHGWRMRRKMGVCE